MKDDREYLVNWVGSMPEDCIWVLVFFTDWVDRCKWGDLTYNFQAGHPNIIGMDERAKESETKQLIAEIIARHRKGGK